MLLILSAFFAASETALMRLNRYRLRHKAKNGNKAAQIIEKLLQRPDKLIGLILLGNNLVNFTAVAIVTLIALKIGGEAAVAFATLLLTVVVLIFAEAAPKTLAALYPEKVAFPAAYIYMPLLFIMRPFVWLISITSNGILWLLGIREEKTKSNSLSNEELRTIVYEAGSLISRKYQSMLLNILDLEKVSVDDVMVPHTEVIGINLNDNIKKIKQVIQKSQYTRLPIFQENIDQVKGVLHLRKLATSINKSHIYKEDIRKLASEPYFIPEGTPLNIQLSQFQKLKQRFAMVVDEYGDIQGIVTLEDILEEIVGEFTTDPSVNNKDIKKENDNSFIVDGSVNIRQTNKIMNWSLPTDGAKTLNGLILEQLGTIPKPGANLKIRNYSIEILRSNDSHVKTTRVFTPQSKRKRSQINPN
ncbi:MAG: magnesium/cobalt efflux protein [Gammaproteobacteria bacterium]|nr:magnesium/cobalt efflux protein [Gammaproteobacteria bacterium]